MPTKIPQVRLLTYSGEDIGMGFNSDTGLAVGTALTFTLSQQSVSQQNDTSVEIVTSHEALMEKLEMSAEAKGRYGVVSANAKATFSRQNGYNTHSSFVVAKSVINNQQLLRGKDFQVTPAAKSLLDSWQFDKFTQVSAIASCAA